MRLLINIPKEFERHFQTDRFEDSLHRLSADAHLLAGNYEQETAVMLIEAFKAAVPVPQHGRLGDLDALMKLEVVPSDNWVFRAIEKAPTIIPADPAEEGET